MTIISISLLTLVVLIIGVAIYKAFYRIAKPDEMFVVNRNGKEPITFSGQGRFINPITQTIDTITLRPIKVDIQIAPETAVPTLDKINLQVDAQAVVQIDDTPESIALARKNFLNIAPENIGVFILETLEGSTREIIGSMNLTDIMEDREGFATKVSETVADDMHALGLKLASYKLQNFTDTGDVIKNLGIDNTAQIRKKAQIAQAQADKEVEVERAKNRQEANDASAKADLKIAEQNNEVALRKAELLAAENEANAKAEAAYEIEKEKQRKSVETSKAQADQERETLNIEVEKARLEGERGNEAYIRFVEQQREAAGIREIAQAKADALRLEGQAEADKERAIGDAKASAILAEAEALKQYEGAAITKLAFDAMVAMSTNVAKPLEKIDSITIYGGDGQTKLVEDTTKTLDQLQKGLGDSLGIDLKSVISGFVGTSLGVKNAITDQSDNTNPLNEQKALENVPEASPAPEKTNGSDTTSSE